MDSARQPVPKPSLKARIYYHVVRLKVGRTVRDSPIETLRAEMEAVCRRFPMPAGVSVEPVHVAGRASEWLVPAGALGGRTVLYLHGGAYTRGSCATHRALAARVALAASAPALLLDYRLAPEAPFPAALDDAVAAYEWLQRERGYGNREISVVGDSAGGGLAVALALRLRDKGAPLPASIACISPWADLDFAGESHRTRAGADPIFPTAATLRASASLYAGSTSPRHPYVSPVYAELGGLPPLFIQVGDAEILLSDSETLARRAREAGVDVTLEVWPGLWHLWQMFASELGDAREAIERIGRFVGAASAPQAPDRASSTVSK